MQTRIQKWGNSLAVRIPKAFAAEANLSEGAVIELKLEHGKVVVSTVETDPTLEELLAGITDENIHGEIPWSGPVGNEAW